MRPIPRWMLWALIVGAAMFAWFGCAGNGTPGGLIGEQQVARWGFCTSSVPGNCAGWRPYERSGDFRAGSFYYLVSFIGDACVVDALVTDKVRHGDRWPCDWRRAR